MLITNLLTAVFKQSGPWTSYFDFSVVGQWKEVQNVSAVPELEVWATTNLPLAIL